MLLGTVFNAVAPCVGKGLPNSTTAEFSVEVGAGVSGNDGVVPGTPDGTVDCNGGTDTIAGGWSVGVAVEGVTGDCMTLDVGGLMGLGTGDCNATGAWITLEFGN